MDVLRGEISCIWSGFGIICGDKSIRYREVFYMQCYNIHEYALEIYYLSWLL